MNLCPFFDIIYPKERIFYENCYLKYIKRIEDVAASDVPYGKVQKILLENGAFLG